MPGKSRGLETGGADRRLNFGGVFCIERYPDVQAARGTDAAVVNHGAGDYSCLAGEGVVAN
jgi:hypothetical protein